MKSILALGLALIVSQAAFGQSRSGGGGGLGSFKTGKATAASAKDLDRAATLAGQANARLGSGKKAARSGWVQGGSGWTQSGSGGARKGTR